MREYLSSASDVLAEVKTDASNGITAAEAASRLSTYGPNKLKEAEKDPLWKRFFSMMADPMVIMLIIAAVISAVTGFGLNELKDVLWEELNSESNKLQTLTSEDVIVHRDKDMSRFAAEMEEEGEDDIVFLGDDEVEDIDDYEYEEELDD